MCTLTWRVCRVCFHKMNQSSGGLVGRSIPGSGTLLDYHCVGVCEVCVCEYGYVRVCVRSVGMCGCVRMCVRCVGGYGCVWVCEGVRCK